MLDESRVAGLAIQLLNRGEGATLKDCVQIVREAFPVECDTEDRIGHLEDCVARLREEVTDVRTRLRGMQAKSLFAG